MPETDSTTELRANEEAVPSIKGRVNIKTWEKFRKDKYCFHRILQKNTYLLIYSAGLVAVCFSTLGGVHVFSLLHSYISDWPLLLVTVLTTLAGTHCMSMSSVFKFLSIMSRRKLTNFTKSHLSVILVTVVPILVSVS